MDTSRSALYARAQEEAPRPEQLERYYARLRLADLARTRPPCPRCFIKDDHAGHLERLGNVDAVTCSRCGESFTTRLERRRAPRGDSGPFRRDFGEG